MLPPLLLGDRIVAEEELALVAQQLPLQRARPQVRPLFPLPVRPPPSPPLPLLSLFCYLPSFFVLMIFTDGVVHIGDPNPTF